MRNSCCLLLMITLSMVACRGKIPAEEHCRFRVGPLRIDRIGWDNRILEEGRSYYDTLWVWNPDDTGHVLQMRGAKDGIRLEGDKLIVGPGEYLPLPLEIQAAGPCMEYRVVPFFAEIDGERYADVPFYMKAHIVPDFSEAREMEDKLPLPDRLTEEYDFGRVPADTVVQKTFYLINTGKADLSVLKTEIFCTCTQVMLSATEIPPADTLWVKVSLFTGSHEGLQKRSVSLYCNAPEAPLVKYRVQAMIDKKLNENNNF